MSERMTVVFDDDTVARRLRLHAAEHGISMKEVIQEAVKAYLGPDVAAMKRQARPFNWNAYDEWQFEVRHFTDQLEAGEPVGFPEREPVLRMIAEGRD